MNNPQELPRLLEASLTRALRSFPIVVLTGSRQTGKSTLVQGFPGEERIYRTLDDLEILDRARHQPDALVAGERPITLDEVQRSPDLLLAVKRAVDNDRRTGRFLLTGSANLLLMQRISESLAGRAVYLTLWPLTRRELAGYGTAGAWDRLFTTAEREWPGLLAAETAPREDWRALALRGGYPVPAYDLATAEDRAYWFAGYAQTYLERDLQELSAITALVDFRRLMRACCLRLGGLVQQTELGRDVGIPQPTVHRHLAVLETSYQLVRLPPYSVNRTKRLIKTPKLYWCDTGLALHLAGEREPRGAHLENLILCDLLAFRDAQIDRPELLFWRTSTGEEVDLVIEWQGRLLPIEVKASTRPQLADARGLLAFRAEYPEQTLTGLVLHAGSEIEWLAPGVLAAPWWRVI